MELVCTRASSDSFALLSAERRSFLTLHKAESIISVRQTEELSAAFSDIFLLISVHKVLFPLFLKHK